MTEQPTKLSAEVEQKFMAQLVEHTVGQPGNKPISYVVVKEGIMEVRKNIVGTFARMKTQFDSTKMKDIFGELSKWDIFKDSVNRIVGSVQTLPSAATFPAFQFNLPKIPINILFQVCQFFKKVHDVHGTEAAALVRWNIERKEYYVEIPEHKGFSMGGVQYKADTKNLDPIVLDLHSHHTMAPFFSGTDDGDEKSTALFGVVGYIEYGVPAVNLRARMAGDDIHQGSLRVEHIFDLPSFPDAWWEKVKEKPIEVWKGSDSRYNGRYAITEDVESQLDRWHQRTLEHLQQRDGEPDDRFMDRLVGKVKDIPSEDVPAEADTVSDAEFARTVDQLIEWLIIEIEDNPQCFTDPSNIAKLAEAINMELSNQAEHIAQRCNETWEGEGTEVVGNGHNGGQQ